MNVKAINGEYAVFQSWLPIVAAREKAKEEDRGYGYRKVALFLNDDVLKNEYQDFTYQNWSLGETWSTYAITSSLPKEQIPQILNWIDWNTSEEASMLRVWGPSDFSTETGTKRRFKPEYKDMENWAVYGMAGGKDGIYYGLDGNFETSKPGRSNLRDYAYAPANVYPLDLSDPDNVDIDYEYDFAVREYYYPKISVYMELPASQELLDLKAAYEAEINKLDTMKKTTGYYSDGGKTSVIRAVIGAPDEFDKLYGEFEKNYMNQEFLNQVDAAGEKYLAYAKLLNSKFRKKIN